MKYLLVLSLIGALTGCFGFGVSIGGRAGSGKKCESCEKCCTDQHGECGCDIQH